MVVAQKTYLSRFFSKKNQLLDGANFLLLIYRRRIRPEFDAIRRLVAAKVAPAEAS